MGMGICRFTCTVHVQTVQAANGIAPDANLFGVVNDQAGASGLNFWLLAHEWVT
jgi:hypothetical protein